MQLLLEAQGYQVIPAQDGVHAVEVALNSRPDLVLLDLELPKLDGLSVTRNLRLYPEFKDVPIIILSGHDPSRFRQEALDAGCNDYLLKPINFDSLHELLDRMIDGARRPRSFIKSA
jgi:DNA-binding response OmpR family regulator